MRHGPIFIGGTARSGKTLMRFVLDAHPHMAFSRRTKLWTHYDGRFGELRRDDNLDRCLEELLADKHVRLLHPDPVQIRADFVAGPRTYARLFALLHEQYARQQGKPRWGDQTELIEGCAERVLAAFPDAAFLHMLRDPRDCYQAMAVRPSGKRQAPGDMMAWWRYSAALAERNRVRYAGRYLVVHYESLVQAPAETVAQVCEFLGESYLPTMLALADVPRFAGYAARTGHSPIVDRFVGRYRTELSAQTIALLQMLAGPALTAHGYTPEPVELSWPGRLSLYAAQLPLHTARMITAPMRRRIRRMLPVGPRRRTAGRRAAVGQGRADGAVRS